MATDQDRREVAVFLSGVVAGALSKVEGFRVVDVSGDTRRVFIRVGAPCLTREYDLTLTVGARERA